MTNICITGLSDHAICRFFERFKPTQYAKILKAVKRTNKGISESSMSEYVKGKSSLTKKVLEAIKDEKAQELTILKRNQKHEGTARFFKVGSKMVLCTCKRGRFVLTIYKYNKDHFRFKNNCSLVVNSL